MHLDFMCYVPFGPFIPSNSTLVNDTASVVLGDPYNRFNIYRWSKKLEFSPLFLRPKTMWSPARPDWWGADWGHMFSTAVLLLLYYIGSVLPLTINMFCIISWTLFLYLYYSIGFRACFSNRFWISHFSMRLPAAWPSHRWTRQCNDTSTMTSHWGTLLN